MVERLLALMIASAIFMAVDTYVFQSVRSITKHWSPRWKFGVRLIYWAITGICLLGLLWLGLADPYQYRTGVRNLVIVVIFITYFTKLFASLFILTDDLIRGVKWTRRAVQHKSVRLPGKPIPRSEFLMKAAMTTASIPLAGMGFGIVSGAHDYRIRKHTLRLPNLPSSFDGIRVGQISDIHSGSFFNKTAVEGGVELFMAEKPEVVFFTGDLVNNDSAEVNDYISSFSKVKAPLGVYSVTGNHDYGNYRSWPSLAAKEKNFADLMEAHRLMGYDLLMNENRFLEVGGERIAVIGIENWGTGRFPKYGNMRKAYRGSEDVPVKILLSHDPSHWDAEVRKDYSDIDLMLAGHTHGFQFGVEIGDFKWSPSQYMYKQWAGLYREGSQCLYVNRGFGYIGFPGRIGITPELTIIELKRA